MCEPKTCCGYWEWSDSENAWIRDLPPPRTCEQEVARPTLYCCRCGARLLNNGKVEPRPAKPIALYPGALCKDVLDEATSVYLAKIEQENAYYKRAVEVLDDGPREAIEIILKHLRDGTLK